MVGNGELVKKVENAVDKLVTDFQSAAPEFWNERCLHWSLFYYLKQGSIVNEEYPTQLIRAEFPTLGKFNHGHHGGVAPARGYYDLAVLDPHSYFNPTVQALGFRDSRDKRLPLMKVLIAIELKLWGARRRYLQIIDWDTDKLTAPNNNVTSTFSLNFVKHDFSLERNKIYYQTLWKHLTALKTQHQSLRILCVPSDKKIQPNPIFNWLQVP